MLLFHKQEVTQTQDTWWNLPSESDFID